MTAPVVFIAADPRECQAWVRRWEQIRPVALPVHWARAGQWMGRDVLALANGAGAERARAAVEAAPTPSAICNIGFCGALDDSLQPGDVFVATEIRNGTRTWNTRFPQPLIPAKFHAKSGILVSVPRVVGTALAKRQLRNTGAFAVEMEAAAVARASELMNVPFYCIRAVSDLADEDFANDFNRCFTPDGRIDAVRLILGACQSPVRRFGELIRLSRRTALASRNLGEFLANCTF
jgi:adenosylhomocysteine nucleosidase